MKTTKHYTRFALCREMLDTPRIVREMNTDTMSAGALSSDRILLSGEGSSRIFPAKRAIAHALRAGWSLHIVTEAAMQAIEYPLSGFHLFVASNSGRTAEGVALIRAVRERGEVAAVTGIVANEDTPIVREADTGIVLQCGREDAVAATKSVVEQALVYDLLFRTAMGAPPLDRVKLAEMIETALSRDIEREIVARVAASPVVYFAGRNDGVAEELTLKTNEITRKRSDYLEGTYAVHGIEEIMQPEETVVLIEPYPEQEEKFEEVLQRGVGMNVIAIASRPTRFPTIPVASAGESTPYLLLTAGWNLLVEVGIAAGVDLDKPQRARKVGNAYQGAPG